VSIIERVAELLGPVARPDPKSSSPDNEGGILEGDLVERVISENDQRSKFPEASKLAAQPVAKDPGVEARVEARPARPTSRTTRTLRVDLDRLREHRIITPDGERNPIAESFRRIKRTILANVADPKAGALAKLVLVTSPLPGEGKTFCAINLALSIALEMDYTVLLVDADVAKPSIAGALGVEVGRGWMDVLGDRGTTLQDVLCETDIEGLMFLPAGTPNQHATEVIASSAMRMLLQEISGRDSRRVVVLDSPPLLAASEAAALANQMGQVVMVVEAGKTTEASLKAALGHIESSKVVGLVLNKAEQHSPLYGYGSYGYG